MKPNQQRSKAEMIFFAGIIVSLIIVSLTLYYSRWGNNKVMVADVSPTVKPTDTPVPTASPVNSPIPPTPIPSMTVTPNIKLKKLDVDLELDGDRKKNEVIERIDETTYEVFMRVKGGLKSIGKLTGGDDFPKVLKNSSKNNFLSLETTVLEGENKLYVRLYEWDGETYQQVKCMEREIKNGRPSDRVLKCSKEGS